MEASFTKTVKYPIWLLPLLLAFIQSRAQVIPASQPDQFLTYNISTSTASINADVLQNPIIEVFAWDAPNGVEIRLDDLGLTQNTIFIPHAYGADVALANNSSGSFLGVIYNNADTIFFNVYKIGFPSLSLTLLSHHQMNNNPGLPYPHIDMFAEDTPNISTMTQFVLSWGEYDPSTLSSTIYGAYGNILNPMVYTSRTLRNSSSLLLGDVAASHDISASAYKAHFVFYNNGNNSLELRTWNCTNNTLSAIQGLHLSTKPALPRIEAMGIFDPNTYPNAVPWVAVSPIWNSVSSSFDVYAFNDSHLQASALNASINLFPGQANNHVAIAAGLGPSYLEPCSENYYFGWSTYLNGSPIYVSRGINFYNGGYSNSNSYQINNSPITSTVPNNIPLAMTSFSNSGKALITAWYNPPKGIFHKLTSSNMYYRPSPEGIDSLGLSESSVQIYPNPTSSWLYIKGKARYSSYRIENELGIVMVSGSLNKQQRIPTRTLPPGLYFLHLINKAGNKISLKFIKR